MMFVAAAVLAGSLGWSSAVGATAVPGDVPFETLGIVSATSGINLLEGSLLAVRGEGDVAAARDLLATGYDDSFARDVIDTIADVPPDRVVLIGVIDSSCTPAKKAGLRREEDGELRMSAVGHVPEPIECFVAVITVAVLSVDAADAPVGAGDGADLVALERIGSAAPTGPTAIEITDDDGLLLDIVPPGGELPHLPPRDRGRRRFAFVRSGCGTTTAELFASPQLLDTRLGERDHGVTVDCTRAVFYVVVFDVPADLVRDSAVLVGA